MTTTGHGHRTASPGAGRRSALLGLLVVALTAAALAVAGTATRDLGAPAQAVQRVQVDQRTFSCAGGLPGAASVHGTVAASLAAPVPIGADPQQFDVDHADAVGAFAGQQARAAHWLAWLPCPEARARWWFAGAGAAALSHDTVLTITNPRAGQAIVDVDVLGPNGPVTAPGLHGLTVGPHSTTTVDLAKVAASVGELGVSVVASRGLVAVSAADRFAPGVVGKAAQEWLPGQPSPSRSLTLAGLPPKPDTATLVVANPREAEAVVSIEAVGVTGTFAPKRDATLTVAPGSTATVSVRALFDGGALAVRVTSPEPVVATVRTVTGGDVAFATAVRPVSGSTALAVPAGSARLVLSSIGPATTTAVTAYGANGKTLLDQQVAVPKSASVATALPAGTRYVGLTASGPEAVAGFSVTTAHGVATAGVSSALSSVLQPVVRPSW
jgi:hypothetical protein